jgi:hypothetical protein
VPHAVLVCALSGSASCCCHQRSEPCAVAGHRAGTLSTSHRPCIWAVLERTHGTGVQGACVIEVVLNPAVVHLLQEGSGGMGAHLKLGRPLMVEVHGSEDPLKFDDLDEVCHSVFGADRGLRETHGARAVHILPVLCCGLALGAKLHSLTQPDVFRSCAAVAHERGDLFCRWWPATWSPTSRTSGRCCSTRSSSRATGRPPPAAPASPYRCGPDELTYLDDCTTLLSRDWVQDSEGSCTEPLDWHCLSPL